MGDEDDAAGDDEEEDDDEDDAESVAPQRITVARKIPACAAADPDEDRREDRRCVLRLISLGQPRKAG